MESDSCPPWQVASKWLQLRKHVAPTAASFFGGAQAKKQFIVLMQKYYVLALTPQHFAAVLLSRDEKPIALLSDKEREAGRKFLILHLPSDFVDNWLASRYECLKIPQPDEFVVANKDSALVKFFVKARGRTQRSNFATLDRAIQVSELLEGIVSSASSVERCYDGNDLF